MNESESEKMSDSENMNESEIEGENGDMEVLLDTLSHLLQDCECMHVFAPFDVAHSVQSSVIRDL